VQVEAEAYSPSSLWMQERMSFSCMVYIVNCCCCVSRVVEVNAYYCWGRSTSSCSHRVGGMSVQHFSYCSFFELSWSVGLALPISCEECGWAIKLCSTVVVWGMFQQS